ncbi:MAG: phage holin family protein [Comamonadaceae bacterium]
MSSSVPKGGLFASLQRLLATALEIAQVRLELLGTEVEIEKRRLFDGLIWATVALLFLGVGLFLLCGFVVLLFWDGHRLAATGLLTLLFLTGGLLLIRLARQRLRSPTGMFNASVTELSRDQAELQASAHHDTP